MKSPVLLFMMYLITIFSSAQDSISVEGKWIGNAPNGSTVTYIFYKDGNLDWIVNEKGNSKLVKAKYKFNPSTEPYELDIFDFELESIKSFIFLGIVKFLDNETIKIFGSPSPEGSKKRPKSFGEESIIFKKQ